MSDQSAIVLTLDTSEFQAALLVLADAAEASLQFRDRLLRFLEAGGELACLDCDGSVAAGTSQRRVRLEMTDGFRELVAAARAIETATHEKVMRLAPHLIWDADA